MELSSQSESFENSLHSINEEDDSRAESTSPRARMKKRSVTNLRFDFQPDIMVEVDDPTRKHIHQKCSPREMNSPGKFLSTDPSKFKKQKTLSAKREKKNEEKQKIK